MITKTNRKLERTRRHIRVRRKISGTAERPRLCVYRSNSNIYAQIIDDVAGKTLVSASTLDKEVKTKYSNKKYMFLFLSFFIEVNTTKPNQNRLESMGKAGKTWSKLTKNNQKSHKSNWILIIISININIWY